MMARSETCCAAYAACSAKNKRTDNASRDAWVRAFHVLPAGLLCKKRDHAAIRCACFFSRFGLAGFAGFCRIEGPMMLKSSFRIAHGIVVAQRVPAKEIERAHRLQDRDLRDLIERLDEP
jgi:hypothetical protein